MSTPNEDPTLRPDWSVATQAARAAGAAATAGIGLEKGAALGRYVVLERLGAGAMGVVFSAYDPELDRKVAVKILRLDSPDDGSRASEGQARLLREAQAMAQLVHPNVITVHDVGVVNGRVFVAMEFVDGGTLRDRLEDSKQPRQETMAMFVAAGRGLAAAHAKGLVHRDFKPENVLVGHDGRVLVTDFGLARSIQKEADHESETATSPTPTSDSLSISMTAPGAIMGTPAYMSPEQHLGQAAGPPSDQFSFCVALYEALYGERPFQGETLAAIAFNATQGKLNETSPNSSVPRRLRKALVRGLAARAERRWPSMNDLLEELERDPARTRRAWGFGGLALALFGAAIWGGRATSDERTVQCEGANARVDAAWGEQRRAALQAAFAATHKPYADFAAERAIERLDQFAADWSKMHIDACETHLRGEQSAELLDVRMVCLDQRLEELDALADLLVSADDALVRRAPSAIAALTSTSVCADTRSLLHPTAIPADPSVRAKVAEVRAEVAKAKAHNRAGKYEAGLVIASAARTQAESIGFVPALAEALEIEADLQGRAGEHAKALALHHRALAAAVESNHLAMAAEIWNSILWVQGVELEQHDAALAWAEVAAATVRASGAVEHESLRLNALGGIHFAKPDFPQAETYFKLALAHFEEHLPADHPRVGSLLNNLGSSLGAQGKFKEAKEYLQRALLVREQIHGPMHPALNQTLQNLGLAHIKLGELDEAYAVNQRAYELMREAVGPTHPRTAGAAEAVAGVHEARGEPEQAEAIFREALTIREQIGEGQERHIATAASNVGGALLSQGRYEDALPYLERARAMRIEAVGEAHSSVARSLDKIGLVYAARGDYAQAREHHSKALGILEASLGADHPELALPLENLGDAAFAEENFAEANRSYARAIHLVETSSGPEFHRLARPLHRLGLSQMKLRQFDAAVVALERSVEIATAPGSDVDAKATVRDLAAARAKLANK